MSTRLAKLGALLGRVQLKAVEPRTQSVASAVQAAKPAAQVAELGKAAPLSQPAPPSQPAPLSLDSPSIIPPSMAPDSLAVPELDEPGIDDTGLDGSKIDDLLDIDDVEIDTTELDNTELDTTELDQVPESGAVASLHNPAQSNDLLAGGALALAGDPQAELAPLTPPPESVEEEVAPPTRASGMPRPTMEQLGETVDLEEGDPNSSFELGEPLVAEPISTSSSQGLTPIGHAVRVPKTSEELGTPQPIMKSEPGGQTVHRPEASAQVLDFVSTSREEKPKTFLQLLDSSLRLK